MSGKSGRSEQGRSGPVKSNPSAAGRIAPLTHDEAGPIVNNLGKAWFLFRAYESSPQARAGSTASWTEKCRSVTGGDTTPLVHDEKLLEEVEKTAQPTYIQIDAMLQERYTRIAHKLFTRMSCPLFGTRGGDSDGPLLGDLVARTRWGGRVGAIVNNVGITPPPLSQALKRSAGTRLLRCGPLHRR